MGMLDLRRRMDHQSSFNTAEWKLPPKVICFSQITMGILRWIWLPRERWTNALLACRYPGCGRCSGDHFTCQSKVEWFFWWSSSSWGSKNGTSRSDRFSLPVAWRVKNFEVANETWDMWISGTLANDMGNLRIIAVSLLPFQKCLCNRVVSFFSWTDEKCNIVYGKKKQLVLKHRDFAALVGPWLLLLGSCVSWSVIDVEGFLAFVIGRDFVHVCYVHWILGETNEVDQVSSRLKLPTRSTNGCNNSDHTIKWCDLDTQLIGLLHVPARLYMAMNYFPSYEKDTFSEILTACVR